jgi:uncharacterized double-CXXCG motif protein
VRREALEKLKSEGLCGLNGCRTELRFRQKKAPELLELQMEFRGRVHAECLPRTRSPACARCGGEEGCLPDEPILDAASMPTDVDLFRLSDFRGVMVVNQRFVDTAQRLGLDGVAFHELPAR